MNSTTINNKYRIARRIGGGSFGEIYMGIGPSGEKVAIKFERQVTRCPQLRHEYKVYRELANCHGFCQVFHFGTQDNYNVLVMELLGPSLEDLFNRCSRRFSLKTVLQIADQMLDRIDTLHSRHLIHRDIKPANFAIGINESGGNIYCVDFGLSKRYRNPKTLQHIAHRDGRSLTGTPRYASINNHLGIEQSRRDDLESIAYILVYFLKGSLPWQGLKAKNAQKKYRMILEKKQQVSIAQLCQGLPSQFAEFLAYSRALKFDAKPDIAYLKKLFRDLYAAQGLAGVGKVWDWDDLDMDYPASETNSMGGGGGAPGGMMLDGGPLANPNAIGGGGGLIRPTTAAAIADMDAMDNDDMYGGEGGGGGGGGLQYGGYGLGKPMTAKTPTTAPPQATSTSWLWPSRQGTAPAVNTATGGTGGQVIDLTQESNGQSNRRPHTAHGNRVGGAPTGVPTTSHAPTAGGGVTNGRNIINLVDDDDQGEGDNPVVAGARAMMRYRRTRATTADTQPLQQQQSNNPTATNRSWGTGGGQGGGGGHDETINNAAAAILSAGMGGGGGEHHTGGGGGSNKKMFSGFGTSTGLGGGWGTSDTRPKSAAQATTTTGTTSKGLFSTGNTGGMTSGVTSGGGGGAGSSNLAAITSYGMLKTRFLSGNSGGAGGGGGGSNVGSGKVGTGMMSTTPTGTSSGVVTRSQKLFSSK